MINVSNIITPFCYSLLKLEPYTSCSFNCIYCYSKWYSKYPKDVVRPRLEVIYVLRNVLRHISKKGLRPIPLRLSTLVDPFIPEESTHKITLTLLKLIYEFQYPLIVNTKGDLLVKEPWKHILEKLLDQGLVLLQISISSLNNKVAKVLEPKVPSPKERLRIAKELASTDMPVILRLSPFIPKLSTYPSVSEFVRIIADSGIRQVIVESLRLEPKRMIELLKVLRISIGINDLEPYSLSNKDGEGICRFSLKIRKPLYSELASMLAKNNIFFSTCKEGLFHLHTTSNCCGMNFFKVDIRLRPTLYNIYRYIKEKGSIKLGELDHIFYKQICRDRYDLCNEVLKEYPKIISKPLRYHEKRFLRILKDKELIKTLTPCLVFKDGALVLRN